MMNLLRHSGLIVFGVAVALLALTAIEIGLRVAGVGMDRPFHDPFAGFSRVMPLFVLEDAPGGPAWTLARVRRPELPGRTHTREAGRQFPAEKAPGTVRIFTIGGSSTAGIPYGSRYAFPAWLARRLATQLPGTRFEVVNAALSGYATRRELTVVRELAAHAPDLLIVYTGHNEFAESRFYQHLLRMDPRVFRLWEALAETRMWRLASRLPFLQPPPTSVPTIDLSDDAQALQMFAVLNERVAGKAYPSERERAYGELLFRHNLESMVREMRAVGAPTALVTLSQNFSDWPPGASQHRPDLSDVELASWSRAVDTGDGYRNAGDCDRALAAWGEAEMIDDQFAALAFRRGGCLRSVGRLEDAWRAYRRASDLDRVPHGAPTNYNDIIRDVARTEGAILVDADTALARESGPALVGNDLFVDLVHPNLRGHQGIAAAIADALRAAGIPSPAAGWRDPPADPTPEEVYAADAGLHAQERFGLALACLMSKRMDCVRAAMEAVAPAYPEDPLVQEVSRVASAP